MPQRHRRPLFQSHGDALEIRQLKYFIAVAEELNFNRAAERLYITRNNFV